ncbi:MAG: hypothetical protein AAF787_00025 [Chloroflexota bacterium]
MPTTSRHDIEHRIIRTVYRLQRSYDRVYPWMMTAHIDDIERHEASYRRYMSDLAQRGILIRVGGENARRGYRVGTPRRAATSVAADTRARGGLRAPAGAAGFRGHTQATTRQKSSWKSPALPAQLPPPYTPTRAR